MTTPGQDPFRARMVVAVPISPDSSYGGGVQVATVLDQEGDPPMVYAPEDPRSPTRRATCREPSSTSPVRWAT